MRTLFVVLVGALSVGSAYAAEYRLTEGSGRSVCKSVVDTLKKSEDRIPGGPEAFIGSWNWVQGTIHWTSSTMQGNQPVLFAYYDVDNDGEKEVVMRQSWMLRSHENIALFFFKPKEKDFTAHPAVTASELSKTPQVSSNVTWPYGKYGLYYLLIAPLTFEGVNYLVIMDELFSRRGHPDRALVVAKYAGVAISQENRTDKLNIVCKIQPENPFIGYEEQTAP